MSKQKNTLKRIKAILIAIGYIAIYYAVSALCQLMYIVWQSGTGDISLSQMEINVTNASYPLSVISVILTLWIYLLIGKLRNIPLTSVIKNESVPLMVNIMAAMLAVGMRLLVTVYYSWSQNIELLKKSIDEASSLSPQFTSGVQLLIGVFAIIVIAPFFEEILFRGIVFNELKGIMRKWAANILQALLFGLAHAVLFQSIFAFIVGIVLGVVYNRTLSIKTSAICHSVFNLSVIFAQSELTVTSGSVIALLGLLLTICSLYYILAK